MAKHIEFHLYAAGYRENAKNTKYPHKVTVACLDDLKDAVKNDHIAAKMKDCRRSVGNFISADCIMMDIDNTHSEDPADWVSPDDVADALPDVAFYYIFSRNHMKAKSKTAKDGTVTHYAPRGKYHFYFPTGKQIESPEEYDRIAEELSKCFPYFDQSADDAAHFFFGVESPDGGFIDGELTLSEFLEDLPMITEPEAQEMQQQQQAAPLWVEFADQARAVGWFKAWAARYSVSWSGEYKISDTSKVHPGAAVFCIDCPWANEHSMTGAKNETVIIIDVTGQINFLCRHSHNGKHYGWKQYRAKIEADNPVEIPESDQDPARETRKPVTLQPEDYTDLGQAEIYAREYGDRLRYSLATRFLVYDGKRWAEDDLKAQRLSQELTARQLAEAKNRIAKARDALDALVEAESQDVEAVKAAKAALEREEKYRSFILGRRSSTKIRATMTEAAPRVQVEVSALDADGYLLNTPDGAVDLHTGQMREHRPEDYCTKITAVGPGGDGAEIWEKFLDEIAVHDQDLIRYLQDVAGLCAIGEVQREELIIAIGEGSNGKSTFFNLLFRVLGDYSGMLSAETLTTNSRKNKSPEYAELRGKRLIIAAELEESQRLDTSVVKKLCSTDPILAEKKFKDPFVFIPSHHVILYTNHLPKVGTNDNGTWRRLVTVPFNARFDDTNGRKMNYANYLFDHCAGAVLAWVIEGAKRVISQDGKSDRPDCVEETLDRYRKDSDWMAAFIDDRCEVSRRDTASGGDLYAAYKQYCDDTGEYARSKRDFVRALESAGFEGRKTKAGKVYRGISVLRYSDRMRREQAAKSEVSREIERSF